jgi:UDP-N-acetylglucosamine:LPS N-acetylglucosamine transferase
MEEKIFQKKAWVIAVDMGYGHQRTAHPLKCLAVNGKVINANNYSQIPKSDFRIWEVSRRFYESITNFKKIPLIGDFCFSIFNYFQRIKKFYPKEKFLKPNFQLRQIYALLKRGWGKHLIEELKKNPYPLISTFFTPAFMAEFFNYPNDIYCVICDADISRTWVALDPAKSRIKYFAPTKKVVERLILYGVKEENIFLTGYPLPIENLETIKFDLANRILNLDPKGIYRQQYKPLIQKYIGSLPKESNHPLTIMFSIGGAGAQKDTAVQILNSLKRKIKNREIKFIISVGIKEKVKNYFLKKLENMDLEEVEILWEKDINSYFQKFNQTLKTTDILWTKPSELSFYSGLGIPILMSEPIGSHEEKNQEWLLNIGSGMCQENPKYTADWFFDFLEAGWFAEAAMQGYIEIEKNGVFNIADILNKK